MNPCQKIKKTYNKLVSVKQKLDLLLAGSLQQTDRKKFVQLGQAQMKKLDVSKNIASIKNAGGEFFSEDKVIERQLKRITDELGMAKRSFFVFVEKGVVRPLIPREIGSGRLNGIMPMICELIVHPKRPVRKLSLGGELITINSLQLLADALKNPNNKLVQLDLEQTFLKDDCAPIIIDALTNPNNKLEMLDLTDNEFSLKEAEHLKREVEKYNRTVEIDF